MEKSRNDGSNCKLRYFHTVLVRFLIFWIPLPFTCTVSNVVTLEGIPRTVERAIYRIGTAGEGEERKGKIKLDVDCGISSFKCNGTHCERLNSECPEEEKV
jgi:hypothetical protein